jgi:hypothetical protein
MQQGSRKNWKTKITSVSITEEFKEILETYKISPTEVFRNGMGIMLYNLGVDKYKTETNKFRSEKAKEFLCEIEREIKLKEKLSKLKEAIKTIEEELQND